MVVSRALCRFQRFDLGRLPANKRRSALKLQLLQWSPFASSGHAVVWQDGMASVWCWDRAAVDGRVAESGRKERFSVIPETLLRTPSQEGLRLIECLDGVEAQYWNQAQLLHSRWWPQAPAPSELLAFQRDCSLALHEQQPQMPLQEIALAARAWAPFSGVDAAPGEMALPEMALYASLALALGLPAIALSIGQLRVAGAVKERQQQIAQLRSASRAVLEARDVALTAQSRLNTIQGLQQFTDPLGLMVGVTRALPVQGAYLKEWDVADGRLKILVVSPTAEVSGAAYVSALEHSGLFTRVKIVTQVDPRQIGFSMDIVPRAELAPSAAQAMSGPISAPER